MMTGGAHSNGQGRKNKESTRRTHCKRVSQPIEEACQCIAYDAADLSSWSSLSHSALHRERARGQQRARLPRRELGGLETGNWISRRMAIAPSAELFDVPLKQSFGAVRAEAVRKISFRVLVDIGFQLRPVSLLGPHFWGF